MIDYFHHFMDKFQYVTRLLQKKLLNIKSTILKHINKNIYTRILFTNVIIYTAALIVLASFSNYMMKQAIFNQFEHDLLRKAKRVNFALTQEKSFKWEAENSSEQQQKLLDFLADSFDIKITVFNLQGTILNTSAEQNVLPGSKVDAKIIEMLKSGKTDIIRTMDKEIGQLIYIITIPMGKSDDTNATVQNGIMLAAQPANLDLALNKMRLSLLIGGTVILLVIIVISVYLAMYISEPMSRLATSLMEISSGNFILNDIDQPLYEINVLADQVNKLATEFKKIQTESDRMEEERARLFAEISHELRTPLTAVQGFAEAIRDGIVEDKMLQKKYIDMIYTQTLHVTRLVDDIIALSRLESGNVTISKVPLDLVVLTQGVVMSMESMANTKNNNIVFEKKTEKALVAGDVDRMEQILRNLLKNAIKATENGTIKATVESLQDQVVLTIEDNGIGIAPEELPRIWDRFYRGKKQRSTNPEEEGSGLGLVIVKKLVQLQDGKIEVKSKLGKGTTFRIFFPIIHT